MPTVDKLNPVGNTNYPSGILIAEVAAATPETRRPLLFGQLIIMTVGLPLSAVPGIKRKMFYSMMIMVVMALDGDRLLSGVVSFSFAGQHNSVRVHNTEPDKDKLES